MKPDIYFSTDIESNGPIPGPNSMLSMGTAAFDSTGKLIGTFSANFHEIMGSQEDPATMEWWRSQPEAWAACRANLQYASDAMEQFVAFVEHFKPVGRPVFVAYPAGFDFMFVYWYLMRFAGKSPFSFSAIDIKTLAAAALDCDYTKAVKRNWPLEWKSKRSHTHVALDDAIAQGEEFFNIKRHLHEIHRNSR